MTPEVNAVLESIRHTLEDKSSAPAPRTEGGVVAVLDKIRMEMEGSPGSGGATNETDVEDSLNLYLDGILSSLLDTFEVTEDNATGLMFTVFDEMTVEGKMPPFPGEEAPDDQVAEWLGVAKSCGAHEIVLQAAEGLAG